MTVQATSSLLANESNRTATQGLDTRRPVRSRRRLFRKAVQQGRSVCPQPSGELADRLNSLLAIMMILIKHTRAKVLVGVIATLSLVVCIWQKVEARDLIAPKEQATTEFDPTQSPSFDQQETGIPQSLFTWIKMAKGYDIEWDTFVRKGWYTQDPRLKPIEPGSVFSRDIPAIYIVFESAPLEDPAQFSAQWFLENEKSIPSSTPLGKDILEVPGHERYGFLELRRSGDAWAVGTYLVKLFITPLGQQSFHAVNQVGTMRFTIIEGAVPAGAGPQK